MKSHLFLASTLLATPAMADISADDVWENTVAFYAATGGELTATLERAGDSVFVDDAILTYTFPYDFAELGVILPPMTMVEEADGTVTQKLPKTFDMLIRFSSEPMFMEEMEFVISMEQDAFSAVAEGTPGDIAYTRRAGAYTATVTFSMAEFGMSDFGLDMTVAGDGYGSVTRVTAGDMITVEAENTVLPMTVEYESDEGYGYRTTGSGEYGTTTTITRFDLPAGGADIMNIAPALRDGMFLETRTTTAEMADRTTTYVDEEIVTQDSTRSASSDSFLRLSADGLELSGHAERIGFTYEESEFFQISAAAEATRVAGRLLMPLLASDDPQDVILDITMDGLTLSDDTWDMFDPGAAIPRDPISITQESSATVVSSVDLVDFMGLERAFGYGENPITANAAKVDVFRFSGAGVTADGTADFAFDNTDTETFDGLPRPVGTAAIDITGANALLDTLVDTGLVPQGEAGMGRMMLGMFTRATGDDQVTSTLEINDAGHVIVNGERVR